MAEQPHSDAVEPEPTPDEILARTLHEWLDSRPRHNHRLREAAEQWLVAKHL